MSSIKNPALCRPAGVFVTWPFPRGHGLPMPSDTPRVCPRCGAAVRGVWHRRTRRWSWGAHRRSGPTE